jgi:hypothetical protein
VSISVFLVEQCCRNHYANEKMTSPEGDKTECKNSDSMRETGWFFGPRQAAQRVEGEDGVLPDPCGEESQRENAPTRIHRRTDWSAESPHISQRPSRGRRPRAPLMTLSSPILRRLSRLRYTALRRGRGVAVGGGGQEAGRKRLLEFLYVLRRGWWTTGVAAVGLDTGGWHWGTQCIIA